MMDVSMLFHEEIIFALLICVIGTLSCIGILSFRKRRHKTGETSHKKAGWFIKKDARISEIISILTFADHYDRQDRRNTQRKSLQKIKLIFELRSRIRKLSTSMTDNEVNKICQEILLIIKYSKKGNKPK